MTTTTQLLTGKVTTVTALPGTDRWVATMVHPVDDATLHAGSLDGSPPQTLKLPVDGLRYTAVALAGVDAHRFYACDGLATVLLAIDDAGAARTVSHWPMPGELGWRATITLVPGGDEALVTSDDRLLVATTEPRRTQASERTSSQYFYAVAHTPRGVLVSRGDGRLELRDPNTLEVTQTWQQFDDPCLAMCPMAGDVVALATDNARTGLFDVGTGDFTELEVERMKSASLHRLPDGRLLVVGLSRRLSIFDGTRRTYTLDLKAELGDRYIQSSAVCGGQLVMACEEAGLKAIAISAIPASDAPAGDGRSNVQLRQNTQQALMLEGMRAAFAANRVSPAPVAMMLETGDPVLVEELFRLARESKYAFPGLEKHLASRHAPVRYFAADYYGAHPDLFAGRAAELAPVLGDADVQVVAAAAWSLGRLKDAAALAWLQPLLSHASGWVRGSALNAIDELPGGSAVVVDAIRSSGGSSFRLTRKRRPAVTAALRAPIEAEAVAQLATSVSLDVLVRRTEARTTAAFLAAHAGQTFRATASPGAVWFDLMEHFAETGNWGCAFPDGVFTLCTSAESASWWATELSVSTA